MKFLLFLGVLVVLGWYKSGLLQSSFGATAAVSGSKGEYLSPWDDKPFEILESGKKKLAWENKKR